MSPQPDRETRSTDRIFRRGAQMIEFAGLAAIVAGTDRLAGLGAALIVGGVLAVLTAFGVERS